MHKPILSIALLSRLAGCGMRVPFSLLALLAVVVVTAPATCAAIELQAPATVKAGAPLKVTWTEGGERNEFITLVPHETPEGTYSHYKYARGEQVEMTAPDEPGQYELRYLGARSPYPTLARLAIEVTAVTATVSAPSTAEAGSMVQIEWTGPDHWHDFISIVEAGTPERKYKAYKYTRSGNPLELRAPEKAGKYEVRYLTGQKYYTLARASLTIGAASATVDAPKAVGAGASFEVSWTGPDNKGDWIALTIPGAAEREYVTYQYTRHGTPVELRSPDKPGSYQVRYMTAGYSLLASMTIEVTDVSASVVAPGEVPGGEPFAFEWTGPGRRGDYVEVVESGAEERALSWASTDRGNPGTLIAPLEAGEYLLRYRMGQSGRVLASRPVRVTPPHTLPGALFVAAAAGSGTLAGVGAVEMILDASGSMLQHQGGKRRIEIAREVLLGLTGETVPAGTPFALRVFGHREKDSCRTDLEIALGPLNVATAEKTIAGIQAMNLARTPIADSLARVADDLKGVRGERIVVLITDGEETCGGDPAAVIEQLRASGIDLRVNIVGFSIDDTALKNAFRYWASLGGGGYHDAGNAKDLEASMRRALQTPYDVFNSAGERVAEGLLDGVAVELPAGDYTVRLRTKSGLEIAAKVVSGEQTDVEFAPPEGNE